MHNNHHHCILITDTAAAFYAIAMLPSHKALFRLEWH